MRKNENVSLFVLKFRWKSKFLLLFFRLFQRFSLSLWKKKSRLLLSLLSLSFLSWKWKSLSKNKTFQRFDNFVRISLICVKVRRFRLFNSSMISTISSVEKYDFVNTVTIIVNRFNVSMSVSMFVFFRLFVKKKSEILSLISWNFRFQDYMMLSFFRFFRFFSILCLFLRFFWMSYLSWFFRLFLMSSLFFSFVSSFRLRTIIAIRFLLFDFVFFRKFFKKSLTFYFIFQLI